MGCPCGHPTLPSKRHSDVHRPGFDPSNRSTAGHPTPSTHPVDHHPDDCRPCRRAGLRPSIHRSYGRPPCLHPSIHHSDGRRPSVHSRRSPTGAGNERTGRRAWLVMLRGGGSEACRKRRIPHPERVGCSYCEIRRRPTLPGGLPPSTIGADRLNFRVRDGNGCDPVAMATEILLSIEDSPRGLQSKHELVQSKPSAD